MKKVVEVLRYLRFSQRCSWRPSCSRIWRCVAGWVFPKFRKQCHLSKSGQLLGQWQRAEVQKPRILVEVPLYSRSKISNCIAW